MGFGDSKLKYIIHCLTWPETSNAANKVFTSLMSNIISNNIIKHPLGAQSSKRSGSICLPGET